MIEEIEGGERTTPQTLAYFYCDFRGEQTTIAAAVLRSLVVQLLRQSQVHLTTILRDLNEGISNTEEGFVYLKQLWKQYWDGEWRLTDLGFLRELLVEASRLVPRPVLVIDTLDECKDHHNLVGHLVDIAQDARLRLFITGRIESDIKKAFNGLPTLSLKDKAEQMQEDIRVHINEQLIAQEALSCLSEQLRKLILDRLLEKAKGMFRLVQCQLEEIMVCPRDIDIKKALDNLPEGLYETYDRIICAINQRGRGYAQIAQNCLLWLAGALTPLTLDQLNEAMMIEIGSSSLNPDLGVRNPMDIVVACGSLVTYDEATGVVSLSHYSVKQYLISHRFNNIQSFSHMHARICKHLITYLLCDFMDAEDYNGDCDEDYDEGLTGFTNVRNGHPLLGYAGQALMHLGHVSDQDSCVMAALSWLHSELLRSTHRDLVFADLPHTI